MIKRVPIMTAIVIVLAVGLFGGTWASSDLVITVKQGSLLGVEKTNRLTKEPYYAFLAIPYAKPPLREKRFKDPEDPLPWNGLLNATQEGSSCMTYNLLFKYAEGDEDCLHLNVYTPKKPKDLTGSPRPVMVWIHGGAFLSGSGSPSFYGPDFLMNHDIVLVSINYRLNVFGFLSVQNDLVPGNAGLKDQVKALKWVKENIAAFGGDARSVTIFGESAGAASVHYLMLSPSARGLFHRAIAQSGVTLNPWASIRGIKETAFKLGEVFDCNTQNSYELIDCLQQVKAKDLVSYQFNILSLKSADFFTKDLNLPCVEPKDTKNGFLTESPIKILEAGNFTDVPFILGSVRVETLVLEKLFSEEVPSSVRNLIIKQINKKPELLLPRNLDFGSPEKAKDAGKKMKQFYFQDQRISKETVDNLINETSDSWFLYGIHETALLHAKNGKSPVYYYSFVVETEFAESEKMITVPKPVGLRVEFDFAQAVLSVDEVIPGMTKKITLNLVHTLRQTYNRHKGLNPSEVYIIPHEYIPLAQRLVGEASIEHELTRMGPSHGDDLKYFFYFWDKDITISPEEMEIVSKINGLWINFAKFGNPTPDKNGSDVIWEPFTPEKESYLEIDKTFTMKVDLEKERIDFWRNLKSEGNATYF